jgi:uncharacterized Zn finger protein (UPF0148 family)
MYCKICGNILASNANFCHVCGAKVEIDDIFDAPKTEDKNEEVEAFKEELKDYYNQEEPKKEEPKPEPGFYHDFYGYKSSPEEQQAYRDKAMKKRAFIPGLIGTIGCGFLLMDSIMTYLVNIFYYNQLYNSGVDSSQTYLENCYNALTSSIATLALATILGGVLGTIGLVTASKVNNKKERIFGAIGVALACIALALAVLVFVYRVEVGNHI